MPDSNSSPAIKSPFSLEGKNIWVVGGAGYLGQEVVRLLCAQGAKVLCVDREDKAMVFEKEAKFGNLLVSASFDLSNTDDIPGFVYENKEKSGVPDGMVNTA